VPHVCDPVNIPALVDSGSSSRGALATRFLQSWYAVMTDIPYFVASDLKGAFVRARSFRSSATSLGFNTRSGGRQSGLPARRA